MVCPVAGVEGLPERCLEPAEALLGCLGTAQRAEQVSPEVGDLFGLGGDDPQEPGLAGLLVGTCPPLWARRSPRLVEEVGCHEIADAGTSQGAFDVAPARRAPGNAPSRSRRLMVSRDRPVIADASESGTR